MSTIEMTRRLVRDLHAHADPASAAKMAAYMKTTKPFLGVKSPERKALIRAFKKRHTPGSESELGAWVDALWEGEYREEKYLGIALARAWPKLWTPASLPRFERMIREGAWWDFVDDIAANLIGLLWRTHRAELNPVMDAWIEDDDLWIRRTAILGQLKHQDSVDHERLFRYCLACADEREFFIRKAIGWALRDCAKRAPEQVREFLCADPNRWSGLTWREAGKYLDLPPR